jgi:hypothetical protein
MMATGFLFAFAGPSSQDEEKTSTLRYVTEQGGSTTGPGHGGQCHLQSAFGAREPI